MSQKGIVILGSTGSIGRQTLDVIRAFPDRFQIIGLAAGYNLKLFSQQVEEFRPKFISYADKESNLVISTQAVKVTMEDMVRYPEVEIVMVGTTGKAGLTPTVHALEANRTVCLANKEVIVMAGQLITNLTRQGHGIILPVDSEPSAIWQCLQGETEPINRIIITASGGPFKNTGRDLLEKVTPEEALDHPTWKMGERITIDSATLMNKGFEVIEARWLFDMGWDKIEVVIHPQSLIHSMVEFADGSIKAQISPPDMHLPIQYALLYPLRLPNTTIPKLNIKLPTSLTFEPLDESQFPSFSLALNAGKMGGTYPTVLTTADEVATKAFLEKKIGFTDIHRIVERVLHDHKTLNAENLDNIFAAEEWARKQAIEVVDSL